MTVRYFADSLKWGMFPLITPNTNISTLRTLECTFFSKLLQLHYTLHYTIHTYLHTHTQYIYTLYTALYTELQLKNDESGIADRRT